MLLDEASVTGTANIIMAAVLAEGTTTIYNAACEPHVSDLAGMLNAMGAKISGAGSNTITIEGAETLSGCEYTVAADHIEAGSFLASILPILFVAPTVGIVEYWGLISSKLLPIALILLATTVLTFGITGRVVQALTKKGGEDHA